MSERAELVYKRAWSKQVNGFDEVSRGMVEINDERPVTKDKRTCALKGS